jgi:hypothetical protein
VFAQGLRRVCALDSVSGTAATGRIRHRSGFLIQRRAVLKYCQDPICLFLGEAIVEQSIVENDDTIRPESGQKVATAGTLF